jgi:DNA-binding Lrp family transcriptional regulator
VTVLLDNLDRLILNAIQDNFPVASRPYLILAERLNRESNLKLSEENVLARVNSLRAHGILRRLGAIFNSGPLGYRSTLCAVEVPEHLLALVTELINQRPEITHNYIRDHKFNVWFTFCHNEPGQLEQFLNSLRATEGLGEAITLPARKVYKIRAVFNLPISD